MGKFDLAIGTPASYAAIDNGSISLKMALALSFCATRRPLAFISPTTSFQDSALSFASIARLIAQSKSAAPAKKLDTLNGS